MCALLGMHLHVLSRVPTSQESPEYPIGQSHFSI